MAYEKIKHFTVMFNPYCQNLVHLIILVLLLEYVTDPLNNCLFINCLLYKASICVADDECCMIHVSVEEQLFRSVEGQAASDEEEERWTGEQQRQVDEVKKILTRLSCCGDR